jgi:hypothetical protein
VSGIQEYQFDESNNVPMAQTDTAIFDTSAPPFDPEGYESPVTDDGALRTPERSQIVIIW